MSRMAESLLRDEWTVSTESKQSEGRPSVRPACGSFNIKTASRGDRWHAGGECAHQVQSVNKRIDSWPPSLPTGTNPKLVAFTRRMRGWISSQWKRLLPPAVYFGSTTPNWDTTRLLVTPTLLLFLPGSLCIIRLFNAASTSHPKTLSLSDSSKNDKQHVARQQNYKQSLETKSQANDWTCRVQ